MKRMIKDKEEINDEASWRQWSVRDISVHLFSEPKALRVVQKEAQWIAKIQKL